MMDQTNFEAPEVNPLDGIVEQLKSYIANPKLVTPETLTNLLEQVEDLRGYLDSDEEPVEEEAPASIAGHIKKKKEGGGY